jgi:hypothetical protein
VLKPSGKCAAAGECEAFRSVESYQMPHISLDFRGQRSICGGERSRPQASPSPRSRQQYCCEREACTEGSSIEQAFEIGRVVEPIYRPSLPPRQRLWPPRGSGRGGTSRRNLMRFM